MARCRSNEQVWWVDDLGTFRAVDQNSAELWRSQPIGEDERSHRLAFRLMRLVKVMKGSRCLTVQWDACRVDETALAAAAAFVRRRHGDVRSVHLRYCVGAWIDEVYFSGTMAATRMEQVLGLQGATPFLGTTVLERPLRTLGRASIPLRHAFDLWRRMRWQDRLPCAGALLEALGPDRVYPHSDARGPLGFWHSALDRPSWPVTTEDLWEAFLAELPNRVETTLCPARRRHLLERQQPRLDHIRLPFTWPEQEAYWFRLQRLVLPVRARDGEPDLLALYVPSDEIDIPMLQPSPRVEAPAAQLAHARSGQPG